MALCTACLYLTVLTQDPARDGSVPPEPTLLREATQGVAFDVPPLLAATPLSDDIGSSRAGLVGLNRTSLATFTDDQCFRYRTNTLWWSASTAALAILSGASGGIGGLRDEPLKPMGVISVIAGAGGAFTGAVATGRGVLGEAECAD